MVQVGDCKPPQDYLSLMSEISYHAELFLSFAKVRVSTFAARLLLSTKMSTFGGYRDVGHPMDWESDTESDGTSDSVVSMNVASQSSATSYEVDSSMRSDSPHSVLTVDSSMEFYQDDHGRLVNTQCDIYRLPADQEELERLGKHSWTHLVVIDFRLE